MADIQGINVAAPVVPYTTQDVYPSHLALYGKGGWRTVNNISERDAIAYDRLEKGMIVCVLDAGLGVKKRYELVNLSGNSTTWTPTWSELTVAGSANWGNIGGNLVDQTDVTTYVTGYAAKKVKPFGVGTFSVGDLVSYRTGRYACTSALAVSQIDIDNNGDFDVFKSNQTSFSLIFHQRSLSSIQVAVSGGINQSAAIPVASNVTDCDITFDVAGTVNLTFTTDEILRSGELIIFLTFYAGQKIIFGNGFRCPEINADPVAVGPQYLVLALKSDSSGTEYRLLNAPSKSYDSIKLKEDLQTIFAGGTSSTVNVIPSVTEGPSLQTAIKDWTSLQSYKIGSLVKVTGLIFRAIADSAAGQSSQFINGYANGRWEYVCHADTHRFFYSLGSTSFGWDWVNLPVVNITSSSLEDCRIYLPYGTTFFGVDVTLIYRRTNAQKIVFAPEDFYGVPGIPEWTGVEQVLFYNFRTVKGMTKLYYVSGPVAAPSGSPIVAFNGTFNATTRTVDLPTGTKALVFFGMDNHSFVSPANYTIDLVSVPPQLHIGGELDTLVTGDNYWGSVLVTGTNISAAPSLSLSGTQLTLTTGSGSSTVDLGGTKLDFAFGAGYSNTYTTTITTQNAKTYTKSYTSNVNSVSYSISGTTFSIPFMLSAGDVLTVTITRTDNILGSVVSIAT